MNKCPLVLIEWEDSRQPTSHWEYLAEFNNPGVCLCASVGFLLRDLDDTKILASNMADIKSKEDVQASGVICIPTSCVKRIKKLEEKD